MMKPRKLYNDRGVSLVETLVALFMTGIVATALFGVYINQHKNWMIQGDITDTQQNARAAIDELTRQIRMAGYDLPLGLNGIEAKNTNPDTIVITYSNSGCDAPISHAMPQPSAELRCDGYDVSCFYDGQWVYIMDPDSGGGEFFEITHVQASSAHIQHNTMSLSRCYPVNSIILSIERIKYFIDRTDTAHPNLMIQLPGKAAQVYAENIEDLQFRYTMKNGVAVDVPIISNDVREVTVTLVGRTAKPDPDFPNNPYRRTTFASSVNVRNLDI
ncbi:MAG: prepilin-type N-terminal cleavage/methylation domain-containing protein [candidate division Zixibacteria bacterium]|nr:prepilin-type N-terminal cleavage/methylation domain-containing protein [candidate division Zixibacteria bacterium]